jgi:antitoxin component YwqK of YwqJK toxin-antitoxin module
MNKLLLVLFLLPSLIFGQVNQKDAKGRKQGPWQKNYPNSKVFVYVGQFKDDKPVGQFRYYYPSGEVKGIIDHIPNSPRSYGYFYHENNELMSEGAYWNQLKDSTWANYSPAGEVTSAEEYKNDKLNGKRVVYYIQGQIEEGKLDVLSIANYKDSILNGIYKEFFPGGKIKKTGNYLAGDKHGEWLEYNLKGVLVGKISYKRGSPHGWARAYNAKGEQISETMYQFGEIIRGKELEAFLKKCEQKGIDPNQ